MTRTRKSRRSRYGPQSSSHPPLVGTVYGMNFENMPELQWEFGYPLSLLLMAVVSIGLHRIFRKRSWI
jgi:magnesium transporter